MWPPVRIDGDIWFFDRTRSGDRVARPYRSRLPVQIKRTLSPETCGRMRKIEAIMDSLDGGGDFADDDLARDLLTERQYLRMHRRGGLVHAELSDGQRRVLCHMRRPSLDRTIYFGN